MIYLTYNDLPSGIYFSQVTDVCLFLEKQFNIPVRLVALISIRGYKENKKKIRSKLPNAIVLPMIPRHSTWKLNLPILKLVFRKYKNELVIGRGIFAANLALSLKGKKIISKVIFDARGAYKAEFSEYLNKVAHINDDIEELERKAVILSDHRLAVSQKLVDYWQSEYQYTGTKHVVIPCTLGNDHSQRVSEEQIKKLRQIAGYQPDDIILIYSGSAADWQSINLIDEFLIKHLSGNSLIKVVLLSRFDLDKLSSFKIYPEQIVQKWIAPSEVMDYLMLADYGLLIRESSVTNKVASPTKFAEYLNAGLKVIISESIGDFPEFVKMHNAGIVYKEEQKIDLIPNNYLEKLRMMELAKRHFSKTTFLKEYKKLVEENVERRD